MATTGAAITSSMLMGCSTGCSCTAISGSSTSGICNSAISASLQSTR